MKKELMKCAPLKKGDSVALIAPASPITEERLDYAVFAVKRMGLVPVVGESCLSSYGHLAGSDDMRAADVNRAFGDTNIKGIFCVRGGYGCQRILEKIDFELIKRNPKALFGYSDVTALHTTINQLCGFITYHTPMTGGPGFPRADNYTSEQFNRFVFGKWEGLVNNPDDYNWEFITKGIAKGSLCGGNLSVMVTSIGTPYDLDTFGKIIFIEDVEEEPYKIDRMLNQMKLCGKFDACAGVIFGDFADCTAKEPDKSLTINEIICNLNLKVPVLKDFRCGHCLPTASLPMGAVVRLDSAGNEFEIL